MPEADKAFTGSTPEIYDRFLVPLIFEDFALDLAQRTARNRPARVLETAAGSGVVTRALLPLLEAGAEYIVSDLNHPMLDRAAGQQAPDNRVKWRQADALALPIEDNSIDAICCQFGVMFFPDKLAGYREARRVLRPGGKYVFNVWDRIADNEFADCVTDALAGLYPDGPPRFLARTPHGYHNIDEIVAEMRAAGFSGIDVDTKSAASVAQDARDPAVAYCQGTPLRAEIEARDPDGLQKATDLAARAIADRFGPVPVSGKIQGTYSRRSPETAVRRALTRGNLWQPRISRSCQRGCCRALHSRPW